ncbi:thermonuclease family protein [bacterium]|nr:thermonuclease family protein [bacterium]
MKQSLYYYKAIITDIYDADTVTADIDLGCGVWLRGQKLRLFGINAPEMRGPEKPQGIISRDWLRKQIPIWNVDTEYLLSLSSKGNNDLSKYDGSVMIQTIKDKTGKFGRLLAIIFKSGELGEWINLNELMVKLGYAVKKEY